MSAVAYVLGIWLGAAAVVAPIIGRYLRRVSAQYPPSLRAVRW
jgi:hypothetical protein